MWLPGFKMELFPGDMKHLVDHVDQEGGQEVHHQDAQDAPAKLYSHLLRSFGGYPMLTLYYPP